jgi:probable HAF family extracellular repeat protein
MRRGNLTSAAVIAGLVCLSVTTGASGAPKFQGLGNPPGEWDSYPSAVSADGSVVVGWSGGIYEYPDTTGRRAFRWTRAGGLEVLSPLAGHASSFATGVSADGSVVVGTSGPVANERAFRWTRAGGTQDLGTLAGHERSRAAGVSGDGSVVVGASSPYYRNNRAFRWARAGGMQEIGAAYGESMARGISENGAVIIGSTMEGAPFRWTVAGGLQGLDSPAGGGGIGSGEGSVAYSCSPGDGDCDPTGSGGGYFPSGVSTDGSVIVGLMSRTGPSYETFRWTATEGITLLGAFPETAGAIAVSGDGSTVVAMGFTQAGDTAMIWDRVHGMRGLADVLVNDYGVELNGWSLGYATAISADGSTIVGVGTNPAGETEGWVAVVPEPEAAAVSATVLGLGCLVLCRRRARSGWSGGELGH